MSTFVLCVLRAVLCAVLLAVFALMSLEEATYFYSILRCLGLCKSN